MKYQFVKSIVAFLSINLLFHLHVYAQDAQITGRVIDENGLAIAGAIVTIGEGGDEIATDENGEFIIRVTKETPVLIVAEGYEPNLAYAMPPPVGMSPVVLFKMPFLMGEKDLVHVPFGTLKNRQLTGAVTVFDPAELLKYDQQKGFLGAINGRVSGMFGSNVIRGKGNPLIIVDGIPRDAEDVNIQSIDQIVVLRDLASAMMYGAQANNGVILITTKRGELLKKTMRISAEHVYNMPVSYPEFLGSADYMSLYNEARVNDGLVPLYSDEAIQNSRGGMYPVRYPNEDYYSSTYLKSGSSSYNVVAETDGGNEVAMYYLNLGWNRNNSLFNLGAGANDKQDRLDLRGNVDYKLSDQISIRFDGAFTLGIERGARHPSGNFWELASSLKPNYSPVLIPVEMVEDQALIDAAKIVDGKYILGGTSEFPYSAYGDFTNSGTRNSITRLVRINTGIDYNLDAITPGLKASGYLSFDIFNGFNESLQNTYAVYTPTFLSDTTISTALMIGQDVKRSDKKIEYIDYYRRIGFYGSLNYHRLFDAVHEVNASAVAYRDAYTVENVFHPTKHLNFGLRTHYSYRNRYMAELTGVVAGSSKLFESNRFAFSPGIGLGWIVSEESFLKDNSVIDYLKLKTNWAVNHSDENIGYFLYMSNYYVEGGNWNYNQGVYANRARTAYEGNPNLGWEKTMEFNVGFESLMLHKKWSFEGSYFYNKSSDLVSTRTNYYPVYFSSSIYDNYGSNQYQGFELGLSYTDNIGDLEYSIGSNLVYSVPKTLQIDERKLDEESDYLKREGKPSDAMFGYVALGLFRDQDEIDQSPNQLFGTVRPGDIRYADLNGDNIINELDQKMIGNSSSRIGLGLNLRLKYKALELFANGTGQMGGNTFFGSSYYWVYGDRKYSEVVLNRWTPETAATATYPRLTTNETSNNFRNSTYWISDRDWFKINTVQLTYSLPANTWIFNETRFFLRGNNLATFSKIKDKLELNVNKEPQLRQFSLGFNATF